MKPENRPIAVISHERSGTHLCLDSIRNWFKEVFVKQRPFRSTHRLYWDLHTSLSKPLSRLTSDLERVKRRPLLKMHFSPSFDQIQDLTFREAYRSLLERSDKVYVVRDGRDVLVSYFYFRIRFDGGTTDFAEYLRSPIRSHGLTVAQYWSQHVTGWMRESDVHVVRFESLRESPTVAVEELGRQLNLTRNAKRIRPLPKDTRRWVRAIKRALGLQRSTAILPGRGAVGGWTSHFSDEDKELFKREAGKTLTTLGYENDSNW